MDRRTIESVKNKLYKIAKKEDISLEKVIIFGSRVRSDYVHGSDIDILLVSKNFKGKKWYKRPGTFYRHWDYKKLPEPEIICLTPDEFEEQKKIKPHIVNEAVERGVVV